MAAGAKGGGAGAFAGAAGGVDGFLIAVIL
jgi:hypothetical protein